MPKVLPKKMLFLLADSIREEAGGKLMVLGLYTGGEVIVQGRIPVDVPKEYQGMALPGLTILAVFEDGEGEFQLQFQLYDPSDVPLGKGAPLKVIKVKNATQNLMFPLVPFPVPRFGRYRFELQLDKRKYEYSFIVRHADPNIHAPRPRVRSKTRAKTSSSDKATKKAK